MAMTLLHIPMMLLRLEARVMTMMMPLTIMVLKEGRSPGEAREQHLQRRCLIHVGDGRDASI